MRTNFKGRKRFNANTVPIGKRKFEAKRREYTDVNKRLYNHAKYHNIDKEEASTTSEAVEVDIEVIEEINPPTDEVESMAQEGSIKIDDKLGLGSPKYEPSQGSDGSDSGAIHAPQTLKDHGKRLSNVLYFIACSWNFQKTRYLE